MNNVSISARARPGTATAQSRELRVLLVAPHFAPSTAVGAKRFSFLAEGFEQLGHKVETLALRVDAEEHLDETLPRAGRVHRVGSVLPHTIRGTGVLARGYNRLIRTVFGVPDHFIGWLPSSVVAGRGVIKRFRPDVVITTGPPFTAFLAGALLSRAAGAPLILDYRDPWTAFEWPQAVRDRQRKRTSSRRLERWVVGAAAAAVFTSEVIRERFEANYDGPCPEVLAVMTNGFHEARSTIAAKFSTNAINILYAGNFVGDRNISTLLAAIEDLVCRSECAGLHFAVHVFGSLRDSDRASIDASGLSCPVHEHTPVDHRKILGFMKAADILYLPTASHMTYALPYKVFDYLSVSRPILAVTQPQTALARLMAGLDCGEVADADEPVMIANAIERLLARRDNYSYAGRTQYRWDAITASYSELMQKLVAARQ